MSDGIITLWERGNLVAEAQPSYSGKTGERSAADLHLYRRGPRGGKNTIWRGEPGELEKHIDLLRDLRVAAFGIPRRIEVSP